MHKFFLAGTAGLGLALSLACGGAGGGSFDNVAACKEYVAHYNSLECTESIRLEADDYCPSALDLNPTDMAPFYGCLKDNATCDGAIPDLGGQTDCKM